MMPAYPRLRDIDLRALARLVSDLPQDVPATAGLAPSQLVALKDHLRCDVLALAEFDSVEQGCSFVQAIPRLPPMPARPVGAPLFGFDPVNWAHYWDCDCCSYPDRTGDVHSVITIGDFYSDREWRAMGTLCGINRPLGFAHALMLTLPSSGSDRGSGRTLRLFAFRGPGRDFTDRDRDLLTLLRPHLLHSYREAERRRHPCVSLTPRQRELMRLVAQGHTNTQIARRLGISEGTVRTHLEHVFARLGVTNRTSAALAAGVAAQPPVKPSVGSVPRR
jgi:DNA-binding CsgD family transcriptional regulator